MEECIIRAMDLKTRAADLDLDIPAMFPALKDKRIPLLTRLMAHRIFEAYRPREDVSMMQALVLRHTGHHRLSLLIFRIVKAMFL